MAKAPAADGIMPPEKMKPLLALSKQEPVQAAIGLTADGEGLILLDKKAKPKKVLSLLRAAAGKAKLQLNNASLRFGRAEVDTDYDSGMVRFFINKDAPGNMRVKLVEVVKRVPYQKVEINVDPTLEEEGEEDEAQEAAPAAAPAAAPPAPPPTPPAPPTVDAGALRRDLATLIAGIAGSDPARRAELAKLAADANAALKAGDLAAAGQAAASLRAALGSPPPAPPPPEALPRALAGLIAAIPGAAGADASRRAALAALAGNANAALKAGDAAAAGRLVAELRAAIEGGAPGGTAAPTLPIWQAARDETGEQFNRLQAAMQGSGLDLFARIADRGLNGVTERELVGMQVALMELDAARGAARGGAADKVRKASAALRSFLESSPVLPLLEANPLKVPMTIRASLTAALDRIEQSLAA